MNTFKTFLHQHFWNIAFALAIVALLTSSLIRLISPLNNDFEAFFEASNHFLGGNTPYHPEVDRPYKYPPAVILLLAPLSLLKGAEARVLFVCLDILACFLNLFLVAYLYFGSWSFLKIKIERNHFFKASSLAILASLRFIDNEFHSKNINQIMFLFILIGLITLINKRQIVLSGLFWTFGALIKLTPFLGYWCLLKAPIKFKTICFALASLIILLIPNPKMWVDWYIQMRDTTGEFSVSSSNFFQGFFSLAYLISGENSRGALAIVIAIPFLCYGLICTKRYSLESINTLSTSQKRNWALSILSLILFSLTLNPLAWHHLYSFLLIFVIYFVLYLKKNLSYKVWLPIVLIGTSAKGVCGTFISQTFEAYQGVLICILVLLMYTWTILKKETT